MRICKVWDSEYPWDVRAEKVALALTSAGHEVHMVARNRSNRPLREELPECTVHRLAPLGVAEGSTLGGKISDASMFPAFFNPRWLRRITQVAAETKSEVILCRDIPLLPTAVRAGRTLGIPVILDMAENYPAMIQGIWDSGRQKRGDWLVRNPRLVSLIERWSIKHADHIIVVVEESKDRLVGLGVDPDRVTVVSNTPPRARSASPPLAPTPATDRGEIELIYLGLLEAPRGIGALLDAVALCRGNGVDARLTLIGEGRDRADFQARAAEFDPDGKAVRFLGFVKNSEALQMLRAADVGLIPHHADDSWNSTIPNKLFDYMAAGITVVASDARPVLRVVTETGCGRVFRDRDARHLAEVITSLRDPQVRRRCSEAGRSAIAGEYNWEADTERLLAVVESYRRSPRAAPEMAGV